MREVLISIQPKWVEKIVSGEKTVEVRKTRPKLETPFKVYIYCTKDNTFAEKTLRGFDDKGKAIYYEANKGKVIGEFVCDKIDKIFQCNSGWVQEHACISREEYFKYLGLPYNSHFDSKGAYAWQISDLVIYDKPRELSEFRLPCDHSNDCCTCKRAIYCSSTRQFCRCDLEDGLKRPPQSWCYIEPRQTADTE